MDVAWLTREQIDSVLDQLSADDVIESTGQAKGAKVAGLAFHFAATRVLGPVEGAERWTARVKVSDLKYLADRIGEAVNIGSPLSADAQSLLDSAGSGD